MGMKYISYDDNQYPKIVTFDSVLDHSRVAARLGLLGNSHYEILGAGKVSYDEHNGLYCHGYSHSLSTPDKRVVSRGEEDTKLLLKHLTSPV